MDNYSQKLDTIFENVSDNAFSYDIQRTRSGEKSSYLKAFDEKAKTYADDLKDLVARGGEERLRKELRKIEKEIRDELDKKEEFHGLKLPDDLTPRLRVQIKGYEYVGSQLTKGDNNG
jgi:hypothetical protein